MIILRMPWTSPPLRSNDRLHWAQKAKLTKQIRLDTARTVNQQLGPVNRTYQYADKLHPAFTKRGLTGPVTVTLIWEVTDKRRRDVGASGPTLKAAIDGMVDAALILFDHHDIVTEERLRIEYGPTKGVRIEIQETT